MINSLKSRVQSARQEESGFTTAELLGNAALGVAALAVLWAAIGTVGDGMIENIKGLLGIE